jgi:hypothetical protein
MAYSEAERERRRQQCLKTRPWERSTGAKTERGKAIVSQNALKTGLYSSFEPIRILAKWEREEQEMEKFRARVIKMREAYAKSNTPPPPLWEEAFELIDHVANTRC